MADKLSRLLETETELDAMLDEARRRAEDIVASARAEAERRIRRLEEEIDASDRALAERIAQERDATIESVRTDAQREVARLEALTDAELDELARFALSRLTGSGEEP